MAENRPSAPHLLLAAAILVGAAASAFVLWPQTPPPPPRAVDVAALSAPALGAPEVHDVATPSGHVSVQEQAYWPPLQLTATGPGAGEPTTPERALLAYARAVHAADWEAAQALVEPESRKAREATGAERGVSAEERASLWRRFFGEHDLVLTHRVTLTHPDAPGVVMVATARVPSTGGALVPAPPIVVRRDEGGRWWVTDAYANHPAMQAVARAREAP